MLAHFRTTLIIAPPDVTTDHAEDEGDDRVVLRRIEQHAAECRLGMSQNTCSQIPCNYYKDKGSENRFRYRCPPHISILSRSLIRRNVDSTAFGPEPIIHRYGKFRV